MNWQTIGQIFFWALALLGSYSAVYATFDLIRQLRILRRREYAVRYVNLRWHVTADNQTILTKNWGIEPLKKTEIVFDGTVPWISTPTTEGEEIIHRPKYWVGSPGTLQRVVLSNEKGKIGTHLELHYPLMPKKLYQRFFEFYPVMYSVSFTYIFPVSFCVLPPHSTNDYVSFVHDKLGNERMVQEICLPTGYRAKVDHNGKPMIAVGMRHATVTEKRNSTSDPFAYHSTDVAPENIGPNESIFHKGFTKINAKYIRNYPIQEEVEIMEEGTSRRKAYVIKMSFRLPPVKYSAVSDDERRIAAREIAVQWEWEKYC